MIDFIQVGKKISALRKEHSLSQDDLSTKLYVTRQCLSKWELGLSIPSVDSLIEICKIFSISIEEILCLEQAVIVDENDIFCGHERLFIVNKLKQNELNVKIEDVLYQLSPAERIIILNGVRNGITKVNFNEFTVKLTEKEKLYLGGLENEIKKNNN